MRAYATSRGAAIVLGVVAWTVCLKAQTTSAPPDLTQFVRQLSFEVRVLHFEIRRLQQDLAAERLAALGQELERVQSQRQRLEAEERGIQEEIAALERLRNDTLLSETERRAFEQTEANRDLRPNSEQARVLAGKDRAIRAEYEIGQKIQQERQRWQQARAAAEFIEAELLKQQPPANHK